MYVCICLKLNHKPTWWLSWDLVWRLVKYRYSWFEHWRISGFITGPFSRWTGFMISLNISPHSLKTHSYSTKDLIVYTRILITCSTKRILWSTLLFTSKFCFITKEQAHRLVVHLHWNLVNSVLMGPEQFQVCKNFW